MSFHVGQLVVCVDDKPSAFGNRDLDGLTRGTVYTVRGPAQPSWIDGAACIHLAEIIRPPCKVFGGETGYWVQRFRPVDDTKLEVFRKIAASPRQPVEVKA